MTREEVLEKMYEMAGELATKDFDGTTYRAIWDMAYEWNTKHESREAIFVSEYESEDGHEGLMIEDDYWLF